MKRIAAIVLIAVIGFISCKKDSVNNSTPVNNQDSIYLDSVMFIGYINPNDTMISTYEYDAQKRLVSINSHSIVYDDHSNTTFSYASSDTVPFKSYVTLKSAAEYDTSTTYYTYNSSNDVIKDSTFGTSSNSSGYSIVHFIRQYTTTPGKKYGVFTTNYIYPSPSSYSKKDTATLDANNRVISNKVYQVDAMPGTDVLLSTTVFTYDNKTNPASLLSHYKTLTQLPDNFTPSSLNYVSPNNLLTKTTTASGLPYDNFYTYTYNSLGLPTIILGTNPGYPDTKWIYTYKSL